MITPTFNSEKTVERTIKSVLAQDYDNVEYIIVDGLSTDGTLDIVKKYSDRINHIISEKDQGISDAFNKGIAAATGDIIGIINSDDYLMPGALSTVAQSYDGETDIYHGNILLENPKTGFRCREIPSQRYPVMPFFCHVAHQGVFVTREAYERLGVFDLNLKWTMDLDLLMRATKSGAKFKYIPHDLAVFVSGGVTSSPILKKKNDYHLVVRKNGGSKLQAHIFFSYLCMTQVVKKMLGHLGKDTAQKLRYGKTQHNLIQEPTTTTEA